MAYGVESVAGSYVAGGQTVRLRFTGGALPMFGRALVAMICALLIVPAAWGMVPMVRWFIEHIEWSDGVTHHLRWQVLRDHCPCATCRAEREAPPKPATLLPVLSAAETQPLRAVAMRPIGNYAYAVQFSDGHNTGIYTPEYLRELGEHPPA